jgi:plasmid stabilization system protein ParE
VKIRFSARAQREAKRISDWWVENRRHAPALFVEELERALELIRHTPRLGTTYESPYGVVRRVLLPRTRYHVYYTRDQAEIVLISVWAAQRKRGPVIRKLGR